MRPISPYLKVPPLAHSTTSPMACFLVVATRRAAVRNSLRSWLNPDTSSRPIPVVGRRRRGWGPLPGGLADPFPPEGLVPFPGDGVSPGEFDGARRISPQRAASVGSFAGDNHSARWWIKLSRPLGACSCSSSTTSKTLPPTREASSLGEQPGVLRQVGDEFPHVVAFDFQDSEPR
jgi:hypothetical protein